MNLKSTSDIELQLKFLVNSSKILNSDDMDEIITDMANNIQKEVEYINDTNTLKQRIINESTRKNKG